MLAVAFHTYEWRMAFMDYKKNQWRMDKNKFVKVNKPLKLGNTENKGNFQGYSTYIYISDVVLSFIAQNVILQEAFALFFET